MEHTPVGLTPRSTTRGRPRTGRPRGRHPDPCARCGRDIPRLAAQWPEGRLCFACYHQATHRTGTCPDCHQQHLLPGPLNSEGQPRCADCSGITDDLRCHQCNTEAAHYRGSLCARCILRLDLTGLLTPTPHPALIQLVDKLCQADRPESLITWKRSPKVQALLRGLNEGSIEFSHQGLDEVGGPAAEHLRSLLEHHKLLPTRDNSLAVLERWLEGKLAGLPVTVERPVRKFATWHHLRRVRSAGGETDTSASVRYAKQEITETIKFLLWLHQDHCRTAETCSQCDVDEWLATGPSTRYHVRSFFVYAKRTRLNTHVEVARRTTLSSPSLSQDQRLAWIQELLTGNSDTLPYRVAGTLLLLYAQPLVRIAALPLAAVEDDGDQVELRLGSHPVQTPEPFAGLIRQHLRSRPHLRTGTSANPWLFPSTRAGRHLDPQTIMMRLRTLGIDLLAARNRAFGELVLQCPPSLVAEALGYSPEVAHLHAQSVAEPWARYAGRGPDSLGKR